MRLLPAEIQEKLVLFSVDYSGAYPCPFCFTAEEAYAMHIDEVSDEDWFPIIYPSSADPQLAIVEEMAKKAKLEGPPFPTLFHNGNALIGRTTLAHYLGILDGARSDISGK